MPRDFKRILQPSGLALAMLMLGGIVTAEAGCRSICISERHWAQLVQEDKIAAHWWPSVSPARCGPSCDSANCTDGAKNYGRCGRVCGSKGEYACYGQKRGWNYSWRMP
jgi:hypothetical protein